MTETPGGAGADPLQPPPSLTGVDDGKRGDTGGDRNPRRKPLIPRKYRGFIPFVVILCVIAILILVPPMILGGTGGSEPQSKPTLSRTIPITTLPVSTARPASTGTSVTVTPTASPTPTGTPDFTLTTSPASASAGRGETVTYTMVIDGKNGFASPVTLQLTAGALVVSQTYNLGTYNPPFPQTIRYPFTVPDYLPPGVTVDGILRATSGDLVHENRLTLRVE